MRKPKNNPLAMRHFFQFFIILVLVSIYSNLQSQILETPLERANRILISTPIIFEGTVTKQFYYESTPRNCWTATVVDVTRIFKGSNSIKCGSAVILSSGCKEFVDFGNGPYWSPPGFHTGSYSSNSKGIFFVDVNTENDEPTQNPTNNPFCMAVFNNPANHLEYNYDPRIIDSISLNTINFYASKFAETTFESFEEIGAFLKINYNIDTNDFVKCRRASLSERDTFQKSPVLMNPRNNIAPLIKPDICGGGLEEHGRHIQEKPDSSSTLITPKDGETVKKKAQETEAILNYRLEHFHAQNTSRANEELTFTLENETFTGTSPRYFEFDVMVASNQLGTYLDNAPIHLSYNANAFGSNISANNKISVTKGASFNNPTYDDPNSLTIDWSSDTVVVLLGLDYSATSHNRTEVPLTPTQMLHVKVEIASCYENTEMYFVNQQTSGNVTFFTTSATASWTDPFFSYDAVNYNGNLNLVLCKPIITSFNSPLRAGIGDVLVIQGKHFGNIRGAGEVWLTDGKRGGQYFYKKQDPVDYISWSDTEIRLRIPSNVDATTVAGNDVYAGSGPIGIKTNLGDSVISVQNLELNYAITNTSFFSTANDKLRLNLTNNNDSGSYTFHCDTSISNHPIRKAIVARAIHDWNCRTEVNWILGSDTTLQHWGADDVNLIFFTNSLNGEIIAETRISGANTCSTVPNGTYAAFPTEIDIRFSSQLLNTNFTGGWFYDTTGLDVPLYMVDFYGIILHELGHAHMIRHVNDQNDPMFWSPGNGTSIIPASNRSYNASKWYNLIDGGIDVVTTSEATQYNCSSAQHLISAIETDCSIIDYVSELFSSTEIALYPNPTLNELFIKINDATYKSINVYSINGALINNIEIERVNQLNSSSIVSMNTSSLVSGIYLLEILTGNGKEALRFIKQ